LANCNKDKLLANEPYNELLKKIENIKIELDTNKIEKSREDLSSKK
ncbi:11007_t:CDS:1, partial [Scutellospora calospora]